MSVKCKCERARSRISEHCVYIGIFEFDAAVDLFGRRFNEVHQVPKHVSCAAH